MTKTKPVPKSEVAISNVFPKERYISFWATNDAMSDFVTFGSSGKLERTDSGYYLIVDPRFDFDEGVDYIRSYGKDGE